MLDELKSEGLLGAYCAGIFPMADEAGDIGWFSPDPRAVNAEREWPKAGAGK